MSEKDTEVCRNCAHYNPNPHQFHGHCLKDSLTLRVTSAIDTCEKFTPKSPAPDSEHATCPECKSWLGIARNADGDHICFNCKHTWKPDNSGESETPVMDALKNKFKHQCGKYVEDALWHIGFQLERDFFEAKADLANRADDLHQIRELQADLAKARQERDELLADVHQPELCEETILGLKQQLATARDAWNNYRMAHDLHGDGSMQAGQAWDKMSKALAAIEGGENR